MSISTQRLYTLCLTWLLLCQTVLAGSGGLQLCMPSSGGPFQVVLNCSEAEVALCCGESPQGSSVHAELGENCLLCNDLNLEVERNDPWLTGERGSPKLPVCNIASGLILSQVEAPPALFFAEVCPKRAPPQVSDARQQFRDVVSLRI